jgi:hypothetical protein
MCGAKGQIRKSWLIFIPKHRHPFKLLQWEAVNCHIQGLVIFWSQFSALDRILIFLVGGIEICFVFALLKRKQTCILLWSLFRIILSH